MHYSLENNMSINKRDIFRFGEGETIEFIIRNSLGNKLDVFRCNLSDKNKTKSVLLTLKQKYGLDLNVSSIDKDLDWI